jgi:DNA primase
MKTNKDGIDKTNWVDFRAIKAAISFEQVLAHYQINWLQKKGQELRGKCPIHQGEGARTFHVNAEKQAFNCFSCHKRGNVLDFVAAMEECAIREAALKLRDWFCVGESSPAQASPPVIQARVKTEPALKPIVKDLSLINQPLSFQLQVNEAHGYGLSRGLSKETLQYFGVGVCLSKGMFAGRFIVPLHDEQGRLVGYAGRSLNNTEPKYLFPPSERGFYKSHLLFNLHRIIKTVSADDPVVLVEGFFDTMMVHQAGFACIGLLGSSLSEEQEELLAEHFNRLIVMLDGNDAGRSATINCLTRLSRKLFVKVVQLPDDIEPDMLKRDDLKTLLAT